MLMVMTVEDRVVAIKQELGIKYNTALAEICGVTKQAVNGWIKDNNEPSEKAGKNLEKNTSLRGDWLRFGTGPMKKAGRTRDEVDAILDAYLDNCSSEDLEKDLLHFVKRLSSKA